jgi:hypothetical protein
LFGREARRSSEGPGRAAGRRPARGRAPGVRLAVSAAAVLALLAAPAAPAASAGPESKKPPAAEKIAGRWTITLEGLPFEHQEILASLGVEGEILVGTLTVGAETIPIASGRAVGTDIAFALAHVSGETFKMKGTATARGLEGTWEARGEKGRWRAARRKS